jgi:predicted short-subunit dehydrogenase-like oxidoreductase (DUF2520 family)
MKNKKSQTITIVGAGKLAWSITPALIESGYIISCVISRRYTSALDLVTRYKIRSISDNLNDAVYSDIIFLCIPDDQLIKADAILSGPTIKNKIIVHFSGVLSSSVLSKTSREGACTASFHIMQTFPSRKRVNLKGSYTAIESDHQNASAFLFKLASNLGLIAFEIDPDKKTEYHLSGVYASNFLVSNLYAAEKLFSSSGSNIDFNSFIKPILNHTLANIKKDGAANSLSGPVERGDLKSVKMHLKTLRKNNSLLISYISQSLLILNIKKEEGELSPPHKKLEQFLSDQLRKSLPNRALNNK